MPRGTALHYTEFLAALLLGFLLEPASVEILLGYRKASDYGAVTPTRQ